MQRHEARQLITFTGNPPLPTVRHEESNRSYIFNGEEWIDETYGQEAPTSVIEFCRVAMFASGYWTAKESKEEKQEKARVDKRDRKAQRKQRRTESRQNTTTHTAQPAPSPNVDFQELANRNRRLLNALTQQSELLAAAKEEPVATVTEKPETKPAPPKSKGRPTLKYPNEPISWKMQKNIFRLMVKNGVEAGPEAQSPRTINKAKGSELIDRLEAGDKTAVQEVTDLREAEKTARQSKKTNKKGASAEVAQLRQEVSGLTTMFGELMETLSKSQPSQ